jgi:hypothetical protein
VQIAQIVDRYKTENEPLEASYVWRPSLSMLWST